jgi:integrase
MKGYVFKDDKGYWWARFTYTDQNKRRRYVKRRAKVNTEDGAKAVLWEILEEHNLDPNTKAETVRDLCDYFERIYCIAPEFVGGRKVTGMKDYKKVKTFLDLYRKQFGKLRLDDLAYDHLRDFRLKRLHTPTKRGQRTITTVNRELTWLRRILNVAVQKDWITKNPFHKGDPLISIAAEQKRQRVLSREEEQRLLAVCVGRRKHLRLVVLLFLDTGLRHKEMLTLTWDAIDLDNGVLKIKVQHSKTEKERLVGLTKRLREELGKIEPKEGKVFKYRVYINKTFDSARRAAKLPDVRVHDLRHTYATRAAKKLEIAQLANVLGHTQIETTFRYVNADMEVAKRAAAAVEE